MKRLLIADNESNFGSNVRRLLDDEYDVVCCRASMTGLECLAHETFNAVLLDIDLGADVDGLELLRGLRTIDPDVPVILTSRKDNPSVLVRAGRYGATDFIIKEASFENLGSRLRKALNDRAIALREALLTPGPQPRDAWLGNSERSLEVNRLINTFAPSLSPVLITGPTGSGKDVVARTLHARSQRSRAPFVAINCAAIPAELAESAFFGHEKGAFTGATQRRRGCFELATTGTLFLDEFVEMRGDLQAKLLRVIERGELRRLGSEQLRQVSPRIITATNHDLDDALASGILREDVYYRLSTLTIQVPPLCKRRTDIIPLATHFATTRALQDGKKTPTLSREAIAALMSYEWPGNLRELRNVMERAVLLSQSGLIRPDHLTGFREGFHHVEHPHRAAREVAVGRFEHDYMSAMLTLTAGCVTEAAKLAGLSRQGVHKMLRKQGIDPSRFQLT